jgi:hypothetical protein
MPPKPIALTAARRGAFSGQGSGDWVTDSAPVSLGSVQPVIGGTMPSRTAIIALSRPAMPAAALVWPTFALTVPMKRG